jgi:hypothetical protein
MRSRARSCRNLTGNNDIIAILYIFLIGVDRKYNKWEWLI